MKQAAWVFVSAGKGARFHATVPKTLAPLLGQEVFIYSLSQALLWPHTVAACVVTHPTNMVEHRKAFMRFASFKGWSVMQTPSEPFEDAENWRVHIHNRDVVLSFCPGGVRRQDSVSNGLHQLANLLGERISSETYAMIHDSARPFIQMDVCDHVLTAASSEAGSIPVLSIDDTVKLLETDEGDSPRTIHHTLPRTRVVRAQTPQCFQFHRILNIHAQPKWKSQNVTDDAQMAEENGLHTLTVAGSPLMRKLTTQEDWQWALEILMRHNSASDKATTSTLL